MSTGFDAADDWIAERARRGAIVITADIPLASRCVKAGAEVIGPTGKPFSEASIGMALATRNLMEDLRAMGDVTGGPKPFSPRDRSAFLSALDVAINRLKRAGFASGLRPEPIHRLGRQRADMLVADGAVGADDEGLGHAVDAPIDGGAALRIGADRRERVAERAEEAAGVLRDRPCS